MGTASLTAAPSARVPRRARREAQLIAAARACIATHGLRETTVQDVAARAGMAVGSISQYFESKEQLFTATLRDLAEEFARASQRAVEVAGADPAHRLRGFVDCYFAASICRRDKVAVWFAFWGEVKARPQYRAVCAEHDRMHDRTLEALCAALPLAAGAAAAADHPVIEPRAAAKIIASVCQGLWLEFLTGTGGLDRMALAGLARRTLQALYPHQAAALA